jgi:hypothetical protein
VLIDLVLKKVTDTSKLGVSRSVIKVLDSDFLKRYGIIPTPEPF